MWLPAGKIAAQIFPLSLSSLYSLATRAFVRRIPKLETSRPKSSSTPAKSSKLPQVKVHLPNADSVPLEVQARQEENAVIRANAGNRTVY